MRHLLSVTLPSSCTQYVEAQSQRQRETQWNVRIARTRHATTLQRHAAIRVITNWQNRDWYQIEKI